MTGYFSRHQESAQEAAQFTGTTAYGQLTQILQESDALFLTVPDGTISSVYFELKELGISGKQICHCSGAMSAGEAFPGIEQTGAAGYSIHPLFPISSKLETYRELPGAFFCLEGTGSDLDSWKTLLEGLGVQVQIISGENKDRYHAACVFSSNLMCALVQESVDLLQQCGFSQQRALAALAPLMQSNLGHLIEGGPVAALTGPVERGDLTTIRKHLHCLDTASEQMLYCAASEKLLEVAGKKHPDRDYGAIREILEQTITGIGDMRHE